jgi:hypothetical protein
MVIGFLALAVLVVGSAPPAPGDVSPVSVSVIDGETNAPVTEFSYRARYETPSGSSSWEEKWRPVKSPSGTFDLQVPRACRLTVEVRWLDLKAGTRLRHEFIIHSTDLPRRVVLPLEHGATVHGTVRDAKTRKPIAGATVTPASLSFIWKARDEDREVTTDQEGRYELHGVDLDLGVWASHPDYAGQDHDMDVDRPQERHFDRFLTPRSKNEDTAFEPVVAPNRPVPLEGQVLRPNGLPVESFNVLAGPGVSARDFGSEGKTIERSFRDGAGRFKLELDREGITWVSVRAEGFARWESWTNLTRGGPPLAVRLEPGCPIVGKILTMPDGLTKLQARLVPRRDLDDGRGLSSSWGMKEWATREASVAVDDSLRFDHIRPDRYTLRLYGPGVTARTFAIDVPLTGLDLGEIRVAGRGRVAGRVFRSNEHGGGPWAFADGRAHCPALHFDEMVEWMSDEDGRFSVGGVPVGLVKVGFPYMVFDVQHADEWVVQVLEGQTTEVHLLDPVTSRPLTVEFRIGGGSRTHYVTGTGLASKRRVENVTTRPPMFRVDLIPRSRTPLAFVDPDWEELDARGQIVLFDVGPGTYRLRVIDWLSLRGFEDGVLFEKDITLPSETLPVKVQLGAGSITGRFLGGGDYHNRIEVIALPQDRAGLSRRTRCDSEGNFCVRYLDPGPYTLFAHFSTAGWARVENVLVQFDVKDIGERRLVPGGTIRGSIAFPRPAPVPDEVIATGPDAVSLRRRFEVYSDFDRFEIGGLWPGEWTFSVQSGGEVIATAKARISGTESVGVELLASTPPKP